MESHLEGSPSRRRAVLAALPWSVAAGLGLIGLCLPTDAPRMLGLGALLVCAGRGLDALPSRWTEKCPAPVAEAAGPLLLLVLALGLYGRLLLGDFPVNHDHPVLLMRAWILGTQMLPGFGLSGYSPTGFAGQPFGELYPIGTDLLVVLVRGLTLGLVSWTTAYCWALFLAVLAYPLALWALVRRAAGRPGAAVVGVLALVDRGAWFQAGWDFNLNWGVWPMGLAFALVLGALWAFERVLRSGSPGRVLAAAGLLAGALLTHPMSLPLLGLGLPLLLLALVLEGGLPAPGHWLPRTSAAAALGVGLAAVWWLPFLARGAWYEPLASPYRPYEDVVRGLLDGSLLAGLAPTLAIGGLIGLALGARRRQPLALWGLLVVGALLYLSSNTFLLAFGVLDRFPALAQIQPERFCYLVRAALLLGCGLLVGRLLRPAPDAPEAAPAWRRHLRRTALALVLAPVVVVAMRAGPYAHFAPIPPLEWSSRSSAWTDLRAAAEDLRALPAAELGRLALLAPEHDHLMLALPALAGVSVFKVGFTPENNYRYKFTSRDPQVWRALGVTHALALGAPNQPDLQLLRRFGRYGLYRFTAAERQNARLLGAGQVRVLRDEPDWLEFELRDTAADSRLLVFRSQYPRWRAEQDGREVAWNPAALGDTPEVFLSVPARDGRLVLRFRRSALDWTAAVIGWLSLGLAGLLATASASRRLRASLAARLRRLAVPVADTTTLLVLGLAILGALALVLRLLLPAPADFPGWRVVDRLAERLPDARGQVIRPVAAEPCAPFDGQRMTCTGPDWNFIGEVILGADHLLRRCIWLHPIQGAQHAVTFENVPLGTRLAGYMSQGDGAIDPLGRFPVDLSVQLDGQTVGRFSCPSSRGWHAWQAPTPGRSGTRGRVTFVSEAAFTGGRHFCFTATALEPEEP